MTKLEAIQALAEYDHCLITPEGVKKFGEPFGYCPAKMPKHTVDSKALKGLTVEGKADGEQVEGMDASRLAESLCRKEGVAYTPKYGRGSQLRECCDRLIEHLSK